MVQEEKEYLLGYLTKKQLFNLALDYDIPVSRDMAKDDLIDEISKHEQPSTKIIKGYIEGKNASE